MLNWLGDSINPEHSGSSSGQQTGIAQDAGRLLRIFHGDTDAFVLAAQRGGKNPVPVWPSAEVNVAFDRMNPVQPAGKCVKVSP
ncbi:MAG TPA: hypothetical protein VGO59_15870 [Verrucomicrobiae bacterium]|jgi:hypothetical protein